MLQILEELILSMSSLHITKIDESFQSRFSKLWGQDQSWLKETNTLSSIVFCWFNTADIIRNMRVVVMWSWKLYMAIYYENGLGINCSQLDLSSCLLTWIVRGYTVYTLNTCFMVCSCNVLFNSIFCFEMIQNLYLLDEILLCFLRTSIVNSSWN